MKKADKVVGLHRYDLSHYSQILGLKVVGLSIDTECGVSGTMIGLQLSNGKKPGDPKRIAKVAWACSNPNGNTPDHLDIINDK